MKNNKDYDKLSEADLTILVGDSVIDNKVGIITECVEMMNESYDPRLFFFTTYMADTSQYENYNKCYSNNGGAALSRRNAKAAAIGESLERYSCSIYDKEEFILSDYKSLDVNAVKPCKWNIFSESQYSSLDFPYDKFTEDTVVRWVKGYSLSEDKDIYVPASLVYLPYYPSSEEANISPSVSTGLSAGTSMQSAILGGIYEVVERDAIANMWFNKLSMSRVDPYGDSRFFSEIMKTKLCTDNSDYMLVDITTDIEIPVMFSVKLFNSSKGKSSACGAAARLDPEDASLKASIESSQGAKWIQYLHMENWMWGYKDDYSDIIEFKDHVRLYSLPENVPKLEFVYKNKITKNHSDLVNYKTDSNINDVKMCVEMLTKKGFEVIYVDVTSPELKELGFNVVKVLIPGLMGLNGDHNYPFLGGDRQNELRKKMRGNSNLDTSCVMNKDPHPFP